MIAVEARKAVRRLRTWVLLGAPLAISILFVIAIRFSRARGRPSSAVELLGVFLKNGAVAPFVALFATSSFLLPLAVSVFSGEVLAGEASGGTLRYLLIRPVGRVRLYLAKVGITALFIVVTTLAVMAVAVVVGVIAFGPSAFHPVAISGNFQEGSRLVPGVNDLSGVQYVGRLLVAGLYVTFLLLALSMIALAVGAVTESAAGAAGVGVGAVIVMGIIGSLDALRSIRPGLLSIWFGSWSGVLESPIRWTEMAKGVVCGAVWMTIFLGGGILRFRRRDVLS